MTARWSQIEKTRFCAVSGPPSGGDRARQRLTLFMALPKGDKMEFIVQKAVELV